MPPAVAVVVATYNRASRLPRLVTALAAQQGVADFEVVIVDDGSTDDTWAVLKDLAADPSLSLRAERMAGNHGNPGAARNVGWRATQAPVIAFTDDDCVPTPQWLANLVDSAGRHDIVQGRTVPDPAQREHLGPFSRTLEVTYDTGYYPTCNIAYRRAVLAAMDGFDERFRLMVGEDTDLAWRAIKAGATTGYDDRAVAHHDITSSDFVAALRDAPRWRDAALVVRRHPEVRASFASRYVWREAHQFALAAIIGTAAVAVAPRSRRSWIAGLGLAAPYVRYRTAVAPLPGAGPRRRWLLLPAALAVDAAEVAACLAGSAEHGSLII